MPYPDFANRLVARYPHILLQAPPTIGKSNSARFVYGGFKFGVFNLERRAKVAQAIAGQHQWALLAKILLPGLRDAEMFVALVFEGQDLLNLEARLHAMEAGARLNNVRVVLHHEGCFFTNVPEQEHVDPQDDSPGYGAAVQVTAILYADVERDGRLAASEIDIVSRLRRDYPDPARIVRLDAAGGVVTPVGRPEELSLADVAARVEALGGQFNTDIIESFHLNLTHNPRKHFVILRGISGTGKSLLAKSYAFAVLGAGSLDESHERFVSVPVEPQWTDPTFLIGYEDALVPSGYRRTPFLDALLLANSDPTQPVFVLLDEMNRAQVEHYFSNFLSSMESESPLRFHSTVVNLDVPFEIAWPTNLYIVGTVNDDESVIPFSPMVLDRANSQDLSDVDVVGYGEWLRVREPGLAAVLTDEFLKFLSDVSEVLAPLDLHFGRRTVREMALFVAAASAAGGSIDPVDRQIDQKILPKLRGGEEAAEMLDSLAGLLGSYPTSLARVQRMQSDLQNFDFFKAR